MQPWIMLIGLLQVALMLFAGWAILSHVKEMRRQSAILAKTARSLAEKQDEE